MSNFLNKNNSTEASGKSINEAVDAALAKLNAKRENVEIEIINEGSKGFLGIGVKDAIVRVTLKEIKKQPAPKKEAAKPPQKTASKPAAKASEKTNAPKQERRMKQKLTKQKQQPEKKVVKKITKADLNSPCGKAEDFLNELFAAMNVDIDVSAVMNEPDDMLINLTGDNMGIVIGKRGDTLDSIQYLTSLVVNRGEEDYIRVTVDTENYREERTEALEVLAARIAAKVVRTGKKFTLEPMNPYERRVIHAKLQNYSGVTTFSVGKEPYRKVVIAPENAKPRYDKRGDRKYSKGGNEKDRADKSSDTAKKVGTYKTTYKADFKATPHKAEYRNYEEYLAAQHGEIVPPMGGNNDE